MVAVSLRYSANWATIAVTGHATFTVEEASDVRPIHARECIRRRTYFPHLPLAILV